MPAQHMMLRLVCSQEAFNMQQDAQYDTATAPGSFRMAAAETGRAQAQRTDQNNTARQGSTSCPAMPQHFAATLATTCQTAVAPPKPLVFLAYLLRYACKHCVLAHSNTSFFGAHLCAFHCC